MKSIDINDVIDRNKLTLSVSTPVKLLCSLDQILLNCFYKGSPHFMEQHECKFCKEYKYKLNEDSILCKKHYALELYNNQKTRPSRIMLRGVEYIMFGRYVKMEEKLCTYIFYLSPIHIDPTRFRIFVYPKDMFDKKRKVEYDWTMFKKPIHFTFSIRDKILSLAIAI